MSYRASRRTFLQTMAATGTACALPLALPRRAVAANEKLRVASVGVGGKGYSDLMGVAASPAVQVVALCDIDSSANHLGKAAEKFPKAKQYADWRKLLDDANTFDAVIVSTPDHMHAPVGLAAMSLGKHLFCQKPLTHTLYEARQMQAAANKQQLVTQMGNQIQSHSAYRTAVKWVHEGRIGKVKEVHSWQGGTPRWPRGLDRPQRKDPVPSTVAWNLWLGVAPERPYNAEMYHPFNWRGWQDFGTGQLGDFGCHILDPVFNCLELKTAFSAEGEAPAINRESWTKWATVRYQFQGTPRTVGELLPLIWYDGDGVQPDRKLFAGIPDDYKLPNAGSALIGEKGTLIVPHVAMPRLFPEEKFANVELPIVEGVDHYVQWADACRGEGRTTSHFGYAGPLTEAVMLGTIAVRLPNQLLEWDALALKVKNSDAAQQLVSKEYRKGWEPAWVG